MKRKMLLTRLFGVLCVFTLLFSGCVSSVNQIVKPSTQGELIITTSAESLPDEEIVRAEIIFSRGKHTFIEDMNVEGINLTANLLVPVGTWDIQIILFDQEGNPIFQDQKEDVTIFPDRATDLKMNLRPANGRVNLVIDLEGHVYQNQIFRVRVHFNDKVYELKRDDIFEPLTSEFSLVPGSYDFKVELFTSSFRATDRVDPGVWKTIDVKPTEELTYVWTPQQEFLKIIADIHLVPEPPINLSAWYDPKNAQVVLQWSPSSTEHIIGYLIYVQEDPFSRSVRLNEEPWQQLTFTHDVSELDALQLTYSVAAVSPIGIVGYRKNTDAIIIE